MGSLRKPRGRRLIAFTVVLVMAALVPTVASASASKPVLFSKQCANRSFKPTLSALACADARITFKAKEYAEWGSNEALASGVLTYPDCAPNVPLVACRKVAH